MIQHHENKNIHSFESTAIDSQKSIAPYRCTLDAGIGDGVRTPVPRPPKREGTQPDTLRRVHIYIPCLSCIMPPRPVLDIIVDTPLCLSAEARARQSY